ncbi:MAG: TonB-dependent receptor plug domain-containing protein [Methylococcales bacterium]
MPVPSKNEFNRAALDAVNRADLNGVIRSLPSTELSQANGNASSRINLRGAGGGLGLVNLDGVPLFGNFTSFFPLSHYPLDLLDRVRVIRGNDEEQTSSRTLGGSLNLTSRRLNNGQVFLHTEGGSYGTLRNNMGIGIHNKLGNWTVAGGQTNIFEGISQASPMNGGNNERDNSQLSTGLLRWDKHFKDISLESSLYYINSREAYDGPGLLANGLRGWKDDPNSLLKQQTWLAQSQAYYHLSEHWDSTLQLGFTQDQQTGRIGSLKNCCSMDLNSQLLLAHWKNTRNIALNHQRTSSFNVIWGIDAQQQHGESPSNPSKVYTLTNNLISPIARAEIEWGQWLTGAEGADFN